MTPVRWLEAVLLCVVAAVAVYAGARQAGKPSRGDLFAPAGKANVLIFVSSDCPIANGYAPDIQRICDAARPQGAACTLVYEDVSIDAPAVARHQADYHYRGMPTAIDHDRQIATRAKATVTPQAVVVAADGSVKYRGRIDNKFIALGKPRRVVTIHDLEDAIAAVIAGRPVAQAETEAFGCYIVPGRTRP